MIRWISYIYFPKNYSFSVRGDRWLNILLWTLGIVYVIKIPTLPVSRRFSAFASVPVEAALDWNELPEVVRSSY